MDFYQITVEYDEELFEYRVYGHRLDVVRANQKQFLNSYESLAEALLVYPTADYIGIWN